MHLKSIPLATDIPECPSLRMLHGDWQDTNMVDGVANIHCPGPSEITAGCLQSEHS
jgi:hypothetical protein